MRIAGIDWVPECLRNKQLIDVSDCLPELKLDRYVQDYAEAKNKMDVAWLDKYLDNWRGYSQEVCFDLNVLVIEITLCLLDTYPNCFKN